jgi:hypothetical protein
MNNNYLILGLVLFFGVLYYCFSSSLTVTEKFTDVTLNGGSDDTNAINALAQIARELMTSTGSVTIPGSLAIQGGVTIGTTIAGTNGTLDVNGNLTVSGNSRTSGNHMVGGTLTSDSYVNAGFGNNSVRLGETWSKGGVYSTNSDLNLMATTGKVYVGAVNFGTSRSTEPNDLFVTGKLQILDPIIRKNQIAGYFKVRAYGYKVPLHYGFNILFENYDRTEKLRNSHGFPESQIHHYRATAMNGTPNTDWHPRYLVVFPGYKIRIYFWRSDGFETSTASYPPGEHIFADNAFTESAHGLQVRFEEDSGEPPNRYAM